MANTVSKALFGMFLVQGLAACQSQQRPTVEVTPAPAQAPDTRYKQDGAPQGRQQPVAQQQQPDQAGQTASVGVTLDKNDLAARYALDTSNLNYDFTYLDKHLTGSIKFDAGGKSTLPFKGLTAGKAGDLTLTVLDGTTAKLRGVIPALTLKPGAQSVALTLKAIDGLGGDLTINATIDPGTLNPPTSVGTAQPPATGTATNNQPPATGTATSNQPPATGTATSNPPTSVGTAQPPATSTSNPPTSVGTAQPPSSDPNAASYARDVKPILDQKCLECHHQGGTVPDLSVAPTAQVADRVLARAASGGGMPKAPRDSVTADELSKIQAWKDAGLNP